MVIDQVVAFVGGIDLCYGRWDDHLHKLTDNAAPLGNTTEVKFLFCENDRKRSLSPLVLKPSFLVIF